MRSLIWPNRFHSQSIGAALLLLFALVAAVPVGSVAAASTLHVTDCADSGTNTLRGLIASASAGDTIVYDQDCTTTLTTGTLTISKNLTIDSSGHQVILDGNNAVTVLVINAGVTASVSGLKIQHGNGAARSGDGGGISNQGTLTLTGVTLQENTTPGYGGGIRSDGLLTVENSTFTNNNAPGGGGGIAKSGILTVTNSTFAGNTSDVGGGIFSSRGVTSVTNSTLAHNDSIVGGAFYDEDDVAPVTLNNVIMAFSTGGNIGYLSPVRSTISGGNNLVDDDTMSVISGSSNFSEPALLGPLGNYGGPTQTFPLLPGSPAIDAGDDTTCAATGSGTVNNLDQRGVARTQGAHCDIGAFESQGFKLAPVSAGTPQWTAINSAFPNPLAVTVTANDPTEPVDGGSISYAVTPVAGAAAALSASTATIASAQASVTATANGTTGSYTVTAGASGAAPVSFNLTNLTPDTTPPVTTATATLPANSPYTFGTWTNQSVTVTMSASDTTAATNDEESGIAATYDTLDGGTQQTYTDAITISTDGDHTLTFWSIDNVNNTETAQTVHIMIDKTPPTVTYSGNQGTYTVDQAINISCTAADQVGLSGLATNTCTPITGSAASFGTGTHTYSATATDYAGNIGSGSVTFTVDVTVSSLCNLTGQYAGNSRSANQLCAPLQVVQLAERMHNSRMKSAAINTYVYLLNTQRGRGLTAQEIATLTQLAQAL
jgi:hypothetical protein